MNGLTTTLNPPSQVGDALVTEAWTFRLRHADLQEHVDPTDDFARFSSHVRSPGGTLAVLRQSDGTLVGMVHFRVLCRVYEGRSVRIVAPEYGFVDPAFRSTGWTGIVCARMFLRLAGPSPRRSGYVAGPAYLPSYLSTCRALPTVWLAGDPNIPLFEQGLMHSIAGELFGDAFDEDTGLVELPTRPRMPEEGRTPLGASSQSARLHYLQTNPDWARGSAAFMMAPLTLSGYAIGTSKTIKRRSLSSFRRASR